MALAEGATVTLMALSRTALYHRLRFRPDGIWEQTGGQFGRSERNQRLFQGVTLPQRLAQETVRLSRFRNL